MARKRTPANRASRPARARPERRQDARLVATRVRSIDGAEVVGEQWATVVSPVTMDDGRLLNWHSPQPVTFNLVEAKRRRDRGESRRRAIMGNLRARKNGSVGPDNPSAALNCLADLAAAVLFAFTAVESLANHAIDMLPATTTVTIGRKGREADIAKDEMVRRLNLDEKLKLVLPLIDGGRNLAGTAAWERYLHLKGLRDALVHVDRRGYAADPAERTAYDRLMLGDGDSCVDDALGIIDGAWPAFLAEEHVRHALDR
jgi:hypothetical protein